MVESQIAMAMAHFGNVMPCTLGMCSSFFDVLFTVVVAMED